MKEIKHTSVIGSGNIGISIAILFAIHGYPVTVLGVDNAGIENGKNICNTYFDTLFNENLMTDSEIENSKQRITYTTQYKDIANTDFIYEGIFEQIEAKWQVYKEIENYCKNVIAIASTTSAIIPEILEQGLEKYKDRLVVAHPWNPPHMVPFVEMLVSKSCNPDVPVFVKDLLESLGRKVVIMQKSAPGFIGNRLQYAMYREAVYMVEQQIASPKDIDQSLIYGFAPRYTNVGIFEHFDNCGLDLAKSIEDNLFKDLCDDKSSSKSINELCEEGNIGSKSGKGFYTWNESSEKDFRRRTSTPYFKYFSHSGGVKKEI